MYFFVSILVLTAATTSAFVQEQLQHPTKTTTGPTSHRFGSSSTTKQYYDDRRGNRRWQSSSLLQVSVSTPTTTTAAFSTNAVVSWDWNAVADHVFEDDQRPVILFDGICNLCNGGVNFALDHDVKGECVYKLTVTVTATAFILAICWLAAANLRASTRPFNVGSAPAG